MAKNRGGTESLMRKIKALEVVKTELPDILANECVTFFKASFRKQGWDDGSTQKWKPRKGEIGVGGIAKVSKKSASSRAILVKTGELRASINVEVANWKRIVISSKLPYSAIHNNGGKGLAWGKNAFQMPQRKFMGRSRTLHNKLRNNIELKINKAMRA